MSRFASVPWRSRRMLSRAAFLSFLFLGACFLRAKPGEVSEPQPDPVPVLVKNENFLDVNVFAVVGGVSRRLGTVTGNSSGRFSVPWSFANGQAITIVALPIGGNGQASSGALSVGFGEMIEFRVAPLLRQSTASVHVPDA